MNFNDSCAFTECKPPVASSKFASAKDQRVDSFRSAKIQPYHFDRLAAVYVRQSSPQQVLEHRESTARQYALADYAVILGWPADRVEVIDEDQGQSGKSAENRAGFQHLLAEVTLQHVGIVLGLEMSRLARSSRDWHDLFELCAVYGTLLADEDGIYDANDPNDRLILGLKGIMSEIELHTLRSRLHRGKLNKAQRGELFFHSRPGYVKSPSGHLVLDHDEQARSVVTLVFDKFDELGTAYALFRYLVNNNILIPVRPHRGPNRGQLEWRLPNLSTLLAILHHPYYGGAYVHGRKSKIATKSKSSSHAESPAEQWEVFIPDRVPAYITWDRYLANQKRLEQNQSRPDVLGAPRQGPTLLSGLLRCGACGCRLTVRYDTSKNSARYYCQRHVREAVPQTCKGLKASVIDDLVSQQALRALEPAALELSIKAAEGVQADRKRLADQWKRRLERARYDSERAERQYRAVEPENRLVARTLEANWEVALKTERRTKEEYDRFLQQTPPQLSKAERTRITCLASDIPALWSAPTTTSADRQEVIRCLIQRIVVNVDNDTEHVDVTIYWHGGFESQHEIVRPVKRYEQLRDFDNLMDRIVALRYAGHTSKQIATALNQEGFRPPKCRSTFNDVMVRQLLSRRGIGRERDNKAILQPNEWWLSELANNLEISKYRLRDWIRYGWVRARKSPVEGLWIAWADGRELGRLRQLKVRSKSPYSAELKRPRER